MCAIHIGIRHDNDLVIAQLTNIEIVAVALGKSAAESVDHGLDFGVGQYFVNAGFLYVQDFTADRKDGLIHTVSGSLGTAARRVTLYDEDLTLGGISGLAVCKFSVGIKGELLLGQHIGLGFFLCLTDLGCLFRTADNALQSLQIAVEEPDDLFAGHLGHGLGGILVVQFRLGLAFETGIRVLDGYHCRHSVPDIGTGKVCILFL